MPDKDIKEKENNGQKHGHGALKSNIKSKKDILDLGGRDMEDDPRYLQAMEQLSDSSKLVGMPTSKSYRYTSRVTYPGGSVQDWRVFNQGQTNSCVAQAITQLLGHHRRQQLKSNYHSRRFLYYTARAKDGLQNQDGGCIISSAWSEFFTKGAFIDTAFDSNANWTVPSPYSSSQINNFLFTQPSSAQYTASLSAKCDTYYMNSSFNNPNTNRVAILKSILQFSPCVVGFSLYPSSAAAAATSGHYGYPTGAEVNQRLGGHAVVITGYNDTTQRFEFLNSYGTGWGQGGWGSFDYNFVNMPYYGQSLLFDVGYATNSF